MLISNICDPFSYSNSGIHLTKSYFSPHKPEYIAPRSQNRGFVVELYFSQNISFQYQRIFETLDGVWLPRRPHRPPYCDAQSSPGVRPAGHAKGWDPHAQATRIFVKLTNPSRDENFGVHKSITIKFSRNLPFSVPDIISPPLTDPQSEIFGCQMGQLRGGGYH